MPVVVKIPGSELALARKGGADHTLIDFIGESQGRVRNTTVSQRARQVDIKLSDATAARVGEAAD